MDCFYAAVEVLDDPSLRGKPVLVGGTGRRGVVAAASYEARVYGVRSATPMVTARRLCPHAVVLPGRFDRYEEISRQLRGSCATSRRWSSRSRSTRPSSTSPARPARTTTPRADRRRRCASGSGTSSTCVAPSAWRRRSCIAKLASVAAKPRALPSGVIEPGVGVKVIEPGTELAFLHPLPIRALWGVGAEDRRRSWRRSGSRPSATSPLCPPTRSTRSFGPHMGAAPARARQRARRPRRGRRGRRRSRSATRRRSPTTSASAARLHQEVVRQADAVAARMRHAGMAARTVVLKVRYGDFTSITRSKTPGGPIDDGVTLARGGQRAARRRRPARRGPPARRRREQPGRPAAAATRSARRRPSKTTTRRRRARKRDRDGRRCGRDPRQVRRQRCCAGDAGRSGRHPTPPIRPATMGTGLATERPWVAVDAL